MTEMYNTLFLIQHVLVIVLICMNISFRAVHYNNSYLIYSAFHFLELGEAHPSAQLTTDTAYKLCQFNVTVED